MLNIDAVSSGYGSVKVLEKVSLSIQKGQVMSIIGRNGVGKTTLLKTIMGLLKTQAGSITLGEKAITSMTTYQRVRQGLAYVPQGRHIFPRLTVEENLLTGTGHRSKVIPQEVYDYFPVLYEMRGRFGGDLSGGQQQQLSLGRALVTKPSILILDEPTEGIQPNIIQKIGDVLALLTKEQGMTIVLVEQYLDFIRQYSTHFCMLNRGAVVAQGAAQDLSETLVHQYLHV